MEMVNEPEQSRTRRKQAAADLQRLGERLVALSDRQLATIDLPPTLREAIAQMRSMTTHGARRRQLQFIGTLMRQVEPEPIERAVVEIEQGAYGQAREFHRLEAWRDQLVEGREAAVEEVLAAFPAADRQRLGNLVRSARKEREKGRPPTSARHLFRYLRELAAGR